MNHTRRTALKVSGAFATLVSLGLLTQEQAWAAVQDGFKATNLTEALKAIGGIPARHAQVMLSAPEIAENGAVVQLGVVSQLPATSEIYLLIEKNPIPLAAAFTILPGTLPDVQIRVKMSQSSDIVAVVKAGGKLYSATRETKVTLGGCGG